MSMLEVPDDVLAKAMRVAPSEPPAAVITRALEEYAQRHSQAHLIQYLGTFESLMTPEELDEMRSME